MSYASLHFSIFAATCKPKRIAFTFMYIGIRYIHRFATKFPQLRSFQMRSTTSLTINGGFHWRTKGVHVLLRTSRTRLLNLLLRVIWSI